MCNQNNEVLYVGMTNNLQRRILEHQQGLSDFTKRYNIQKLVFFELTHDVTAAIEREKQIKSWSRKRKNDLVNSRNPDWTDLSVSL